MASDKRRQTLGSTAVGLTLQFHFYYISEETKGTLDSEQNHEVMKSCGRKRKYEVFKQDIHLDLGTEFSSLLLNFQTLQSSVPKSCKKATFLSMNSMKISSIQASNCWNNTFSIVPRMGSQTTRKYNDSIVTYFINTTKLNKTIDTWSDSNKGCV